MEDTNTDLPTNKESSTLTIESWSHSKLNFLHDISISSMRLHYGNVCIMYTITLMTRFSKLVIL